MLSHVRPVLVDSYSVLTQVSSVVFFVSTSFASKPHPVPLIASADL